jgi:hypothetical protein
MVDLGGGIDVVSNAMALAIAARVRDDADTGWGAPIPAYDSVLVPFDPDRLDPAEAETRLRDSSRGRWKAIVAHGREAAPIPVRYGGPDGPDLNAVAERVGLAAPARSWTPLGRVPVFVLGFAPGFGYLGRCQPSWWCHVGTSRGLVCRQAALPSPAGRPPSIRVDTGRLASHRPDRRRPLGRAALRSALLAAGDRSASNPSHADVLRVVEAGLLSTVRMAADPARRTSACRSQVPAMPGRWPWPIACSTTHRAPRCSR